MSSAHELLLAASIVVATARQFRATIWTLDAEFSALAGVRYIPKRK